MQRDKNWLHGKNVICIWLSPAALAVVPPLAGKPVVRTISRMCSEVETRYTPRWLGGLGGVYTPPLTMMFTVFPTRAIFGRTALNMWFILWSRHFHIYRNNHFMRWHRLRILGSVNERVRTGLLALNQINSINMYWVPAMAQAQHRC